MCLEMDNPQQKSGIIRGPDGIHPRRVVWPFGLGDALCQGRALITIFIVIFIMLTMSAKIIGLCPQMKDKHEHVIVPTENKKSES